MTAVYVLNLDRSKERLERITEELRARSVTFERVPAVDSETMPEASWAGRFDAARNRRDYLAPLTPAEIACVLTHRAAWLRLLADEEADSAVILEDDVTMLASAEETMSFVHRTCATDAPVLCKLNSLRARTLPGVPFSARPAFLPALTAAAQALNKPAAKRLIEFTESFHEPVDVALQRWWDHGVRMLQATPPLFAEIRGAHYQSTIRRVHEGPPEGRLLRELRRPVFQLRRVLRATTAAISVSGSSRRPGGEQ